MQSRRRSLAAAVVLLAVAVTGVALSRVERSAPALPTALASMPAETLAASVTDWARVRSILRPGAGGTARIVDRAYETDASAVSVLGDRAEVMRERYGWSVLQAQWEGLAQSRQGAAVVVQMPADFDMDVVREGLRDLGYRPPFESDEVWRGGTDLVASIDASLTPLMAHAAVLDDTQRVVFSDRAAYAARTAGVVSGSIPSLGQRESVRAVSDGLSGGVASMLLVGRHGCQVMGFGRASGGDRALARRRVRDVGGLQPFSSVGLALVPDSAGGLRRPPLVVAMHFDDVRAAAGEAERRLRLATGEAPGQGGTYGSRFAATTQQRGGDVVLRLRPRSADAQLLSDLGSGELLFAGCG